MTLDEWLRSAWSRTKRYLEELACAVDYDPVEEQRRWIAGLEERIARLEAEPPPVPEPSSRRPTET